MAVPPEPESAAGLLSRTAAFAVDAALLLAGILITHSIWYLLDGWGGREPSGFELALNLAFTVSLPAWLYFSWMEASSSQATVGKRLLRILVADAYGSRISIARASVRTLVKLIPWELAHMTLCLPTPIFFEGSEDRLRPGFWLFYGLIGLYLAAAMTTRRKQSVHDLAAGTYVVRAA